MRKEEQGLSLSGLIFVLAILGFLAVMAAKLVPTYLEYFSIKKILASMTHDSNFKTASVRELRQSFDRRAQIDNITSVKGDDLEITKEGGLPVVTAAYSVRVPLFANVSALIDFTASTQ